MLQTLIYIAICLTLESVQSPSTPSTREMSTEQVTNLDVGDGEGVSDTEGRALVGFHLASNVLEQVLNLAGYQSLALLQLLLLKLM